MSEYAGRQIVGMDLHRHRSVLVRISNDPDYLRAVMAWAREDPQVVLEATDGWYWAVDVLSECGRMGRLPEAWIAPPDVRELRELVRL